MLTRATVKDTKPCNPAANAQRAAQIRPAYFGGCRCIWLTSLWKAGVEHRATIVNTGLVHHKTKCAGRGARFYTKLGSLGIGELGP
jgi:hypothetical protein